MVNHFVIRAARLDKHVEFMAPLSLGHECAS